MRIIEKIIIAKRRTAQIRANKIRSAKKIRLANTRRIAKKRITKIKINKIRSVKIKITTRRKTK